MGWKIGSMGVESDGGNHRQSRAASANATVCLIKIGWLYFANHLFVSMVWFLQSAFPTRTLVVISRFRISSNKPALDEGAAFDGNIPGSYQRC
jgi:hypothetical protein